MAYIPKNPTKTNHQIDIFENWIGIRETIHLKILLEERFLMFSDCNRPILSSSDSNLHSYIISNT